MFKKLLIQVVLLLTIIGEVWAVEKDVMEDVIFRERNEDSRITKILNEEKILDSAKGDVVTDIFGKRVRSEIYLLRPESNQLRHLLLTYRKDSLNYCWKLVTYKKDVPTVESYGSDEDYTSVKVQELLDIIDYKASKDYNNYAVRIECYASNREDYLKEVYTGGFLAEKEELQGQYDRLRFKNYTRIINGNVKAEYERVDNGEDEFGHEGGVNWTFAGGSRDWNVTCGDKYEGFDVNIEVDTIYGDGSKENMKEYWFDWQYSGNDIQLIITASEFEGRKIDLLIGGFDFCNMNSPLTGNSPLYFPGDGLIRNRDGGYY